MQKKKYTDLSVPQLKKLQKVFLGIFLGLVILWIIVLSMMYYNGKSIATFIALAIATLIPNFINILNISNQIKQNKPNDLPINIIILATTSQILESKSDGLRVIKKKYDKDYPTNITTIKYFEKAKDEDFLQYGSTAKNLYLLLLEDL